MQIIEDIQLDYSDVLIKPRRSTIVSRKDADITREYKYKTKNGVKYIKGTGIMQANMGTIGNFKVSLELLNKNLFACLHKHHDSEKLVSFYKNLDEYSFVHVSRDQNRHADAEANRAIDEYEKTISRRQ